MNPVPCLSRLACLEVKEGCGGWGPLQSRQTGHLARRPLGHRRGAEHFTRAPSPVKSSPKVCVSLCLSASPHSPHHTRPNLPTSLPLDCRPICISSIYLLPIFQSWEKRSPFGKLTIPTAPLSKWEPDSAGAGAPRRAGSGAGPGDHEAVTPIDQTPIRQLLGTMVGLPMLLPSREDKGTV